MAAISDLSVSPNRLRLILYVLSIIIIIALFVEILRFEKYVSDRADADDQAKVDNCYRSQVLGNQVLIISASLTPLIEGVVKGADEAKPPPPDTPLLRQFRQAAIDLRDGLDTLKRLYPPDRCLRISTELGKEPSGNLN